MWILLFSEYNVSTILSPIVGGFYFKTEEEKKDKNTESNQMQCGEAAQKETIIRLNRYWARQGQARCIVYTEVIT